MNRLGTRMGVGSLAAGALALAACGPEFTTATGGSGGTGASGGTMGTGAGASSGSSTSGGACTPGDLAACGPKYYCSKDTSTCQLCSSASSFTFGNGGTAVTTSATGSNSFPRMAPGTSDLYFIQQALPVNDVPSPTNVMVMKATSTQGTWEPPMPLNAPFLPAAPDTVEGLLPWSDALALKETMSPSTPLTGSTVKSLDATLLYGVGAPGNLPTDPQTYSIWAANLDGTTAAQVQLPLGMSDRSVAVSFAVAPSRFYYLKDGSLVTWVQGDGTSAQMVKSFDYDMTSCQVIQISDPWVEPGGGRLLFTAPLMTGSPCAAPDSQSRLFYVDLGSDGQPSGSAKQIFSGDDMDYDLTPSMSADGCLLVWARSNGAVPPVTNILVSVRQ